MQAQHRDLLERKPVFLEYFFVVEIYIVHSQYPNIHVFKKKSNARLFFFEIHTIPEERCVINFLGGYLSSIYMSNFWDNFRPLNPNQ